MKFWALFLFLIASCRVYAFDLPHRLDANDRREVARTLGFNTSSKILSNPYPLGGYSGFEFGVGYETINVEDLSRLGCRPSDPGCPNQESDERSELNYARISIGKGLYENIDFFFNFVPPFTEDLSDFGGIIRWSFFQAKFLPINISLLAHVNRLNLKDSFISENIGTQLIAGINVDNFSLYFGGGYMKSESIFMGGDSPPGSISPHDPQLSSDTNTIQEILHTTHTLVGFSLHHEKIFTVLQIDRYRDAVFSAKLGLRY